MLWKIYSTDNLKFPYRLKIENDKEIILDLLVQDKWPGTKGNIFCLRSTQENLKELDKLPLIEEVPVFNFQKYGKRWSCVLSRPIRKRFSFLFLQKKFKNKDEFYEQIFWQTQTGLTSYKAKYKLSVFKTFRN